MEWIKAKDRLPAAHVNVWVWIKYKKGPHRDRSYSLGRESWLCSDGRWAMGSAEDFIITHWMPLPEPPKRRAQPPAGQ